jgi:hypothetical protein
MPGQEGPTWMHKLLSKMAGSLLKKGNYGFPIEQKLYDMYVKATGQAQKKTTNADAEYQQLQPEFHAQLTDKSSNWTKQKPTVAQAAKATHKEPGAIHSLRALFLLSTETNGTSSTSPRSPNDVSV